MWFICMIVVKRLADMGERTAIQRITKLLTRGKGAQEIGDDCAILAFDDNYLLVTTDMITRSTHIPSKMTARQIGWFLVAINLSDIAAKGGTPLGLVLSYGLPKETPEDFLVELVKGADSCAVQYDTTILGGDTKEAQDLTLCGTALGIVPQKEFMPRRGATPGDVVAVTGSLGKAGAGYRALQQNIQDEKIQKGLLLALPRIKEGRILARSQCVTSCMDLSDGLSSSLYQLQELNKVGFEISSNALPIAPELLILQQKDPTLDKQALLLHFGGDYELLLTLPPENFRSVQHALEQSGSSLTTIGTVTTSNDVLLLEKGKKRILENKGYEHFKPWMFG